MDPKDREIAALKQQLQQLTRENAVLSNLLTVISQSTSPCSSSPVSPVRPPASQNHRDDDDNNNNNANDETDQRRMERLLDKEIKVTADESETRRQRNVQHQQQQQQQHSATRETLSPQSRRELSPLDRRIAQANILLAKVMQANVISNELGQCCMFELTTTKGTSSETATTSVIVRKTRSGGTAESYLWSIDKFERRLISMVLIWDEWRQAQGDELGGKKQRQKFLQLPEDDSNPFVDVALTDD